MQIIAGFNWLKNGKTIRTPKSWNFRFCSNNPKLKVEVKSATVEKQKSEPPKKS